MKIDVYETDDDAINAVVMDGDAVINVVSGFEDEGMSRSEFVAAARSGFAGASYDSSKFSGMEMRQAAKQIKETERLIAEITQDRVEMHPEKMGLAGHILFEIGQFI